MNPFCSTEQRTGVSMDSTSTVQSAATETAPPSLTTPIVPDDETYVIHGKIVGSQSGGGGHAFAPGYVQFLIETADGRQEWHTLSTYQQMKYPCSACKAQPPAGLTSYGRNSWVLVTSLHGHHVVRSLAEEFRH